MKGKKQRIEENFKRSQKELFLNLLILKRKLHIKLQDQSSEFLTCGLNPTSLSRQWFFPWCLLS